ncbi:hypothetical protein [Sneathiella glossodoripedis]|uniref:hypothetical protein n=1 Tax=Sneathiella glossodoripedis TaxID=418853 RepID=UPI000470885A|nr:hypothetical protein [Sneathiella glossodoripedis]
MPGLYIKLVVGLLICFQTGACSYIPDPKLQKMAVNLSQSAQLIGELHEISLEFSEEANRLALQTNLNLQFDLGGRPNTNFPALFTANDIRLRRQLVHSLQVYSLNILNALQLEGELSEPTKALDLGGMKDIDLKGFGNLSEEHLDIIGNKIGQFSSYFYYPKTIAKLAELVSEANPDIQRIVFLLYLDVGDVRSDTKSCDTSRINPSIPIKLNTIPACRAGLRALVNESLLHINKTWRTRINLALPKELKESPNRPLLLDRIYRLERFQEEVEQIFLQLRDSYLQFAVLHSEFKRLLASSSDRVQKSEDYLSFPSPNVATTYLPANQRHLVKNISALRSKLKDLTRGEIHDN